MIIMFKDEDTKKTLVDYDKTYAELKQSDCGISNILISNAENQYKKTLTNRQVLRAASASVAGFFAYAGISHISKETIGTAVLCCAYSFGCGVLFKQTNDLIKHMKENKNKYIVKTMWNGNNVPNLTRD